MQVEGIMTRRVVTATPSTPAHEAELMMQRGRFRHLPVMDDGRLVGIVSERELRVPTGLTAETARVLEERRVGAVMHAPVITVAPEDPVEDAARLLHDNKIGCLPVMRGGALVGMVTTSDVFRAYVESTGILEPSTRVEIVTDDVAGALGVVAAVCGRERLAIAGITLERESGSAERRLVVRFATIQGMRLLDALRASGLTVASPAEPGLE